MQRYSDYGSMQRAAQRRVYEMQRRSRAALENNRYIPKPDTEPECAAAPPECEPAPEREVPPVCRSAPEQKTDPELFLLAAILALLVSENADPRLIAALLYII